VLKNLLNSYGLSNSDKPYFFTTTEFYNKFRNNQPLKELPYPLSNALLSLYKKNFLKSFKNKINNYAPIYYKPPHKKINNQNDLINYSPY
jgi:hypothetical protein